MIFTGFILYDYFLTIIELVWIWLQKAYIANALSLGSDVVELGGIRLWGLMSVYKDKCEQCYIMYNIFSFWGC